MIYCGIGSRETPEQVCHLMIEIGFGLAQLGWTLRSGGADGADIAFEIGCNQGNGTKEIYIPWHGFNQRSTHEPGVIRGANEYTEEIAAMFHPNWSACSNGAKALHARNVCQVLGFNRQTPADMVVCWTPNASGSGGTGQALRMAKHFNIPIFDLARQEAKDQLIQFVKSH